jgi:hypothetical protein
MMMSRRARTGQAGRARGDVLAGNRPSQGSRARCSELLQRRRVSGGLRREVAGKRLRAASGQRREDGCGETWTGSASARLPCTECGGSTATGNPADSESEGTATDVIRGLMRDERSSLHKLPSLSLECLHLDLMQTAVAAVKRRSVKMGEVGCGGAAAGKTGLGRQDDSPDQESKTNLGGASGR